MSTAVASPGRTDKAAELECEFRVSRAKRVMDCVLASAALIVVLPMSLVIALAILMDSRGPVLYAQERVGFDRRRRNVKPAVGDRRTKLGFGRPIKIYKFRSMIKDAEKQTGPVWALDKDPRATRVGAVLRRTHLDELPQLFNVLLGEMSIVGPRPERPQLVRQLVVSIPEYSVRSRVLPGITGVAQIRNGYDDSLQSAARKVQYDLHYMRNWSLRMDLEIMASTAMVLIRGKDHSQNGPDVGGRA